MCDESWLPLQHYQSAVVNGLLYSFHTTEASYPCLSYEEKLKDPGKPHVSLFSVLHAKWGEMDELKFGACIY
jgi:hypothetical protein